MKNLKKIFSPTCWWFLSLLFLPISESNSQVIKMSAKDMTEVSTAVFYGKCSKLRTEWNENRNIIYTYVTIVPEEYIKGNLGSEAVITIPGGKVDNIIYEVSEMPVFSEGEEVVAFVWTNPRGKNLITGGYKGKMKIDKDEKTGERMVEVNAEMLEETEGQEKIPPGQSKKMGLEDFVGKIKGWAKH